MPSATSSWVVTSAPAGGSNSTSAVSRSESDPSVPTSGRASTRSTTRIGTCWPLSEMPDDRGRGVGERDPAALLRGALGAGALGDQGRDRVRRGRGRDPGEAGDLGVLRPLARRQVAEVEPQPQSRVTRLQHDGRVHQRHRERPGRSPRPRLVQVPVLVATVHRHPGEGEHALHVADRDAAARHVELLERAGLLAVLDPGGEALLTGSVADRPHQHVGLLPQVVDVLELQGGPGPGRRTQRDVLHGHGQAPCR